jgi:hypothetical protein
MSPTTGATLLNGRCRGWGINMENKYEISIRLLSDDYVFENNTKTLEDQFKDINIKKELYLSCTINNDQFGFEIDTKLIDLISNYGYSLIVSGIAFL